MNFLILAGGTAGDINPLIGFTKGLVQRGYKVTFCTNSYFEDVVIESGASFVSTGEKEIYLKHFNTADTWNKIELFSIWESLLFPSTMKIIKLLESSVDDNTILINTMSTIQLRVARDIWKRPLITFGLSPYQYYDILDENQTANLEEKNELRSINKRLCHQLAQIYESQNINIPIYNLNNWRFSPDINIGLWPSWFKLSNETINTQLNLVNFIQDDGNYETNIPDELMAFLDSKPIIATGGSLIRHTRHFLPLLKICEKLQKPLLIVSKEFSDINIENSNIFRYEKSISFREVLPLCSALVHTGGIGTVARGIYSEIPQLIFPQVGDQFTNAKIIQELGLGLKIDHLEEVESKLSEVLQSEHIRRNTREKSRLCVTDIDNLLDLIFNKLKYIL